jgi:hypothetical protein
LEASLNNTGRHILAVRELTKVSQTRVIVVFDDRIYIGQIDWDLIIKDRDVAFSDISFYVVILNNITLALKE